MPYFAVKASKRGADVCVCREETISDVQTETILGPGDWLVREISEMEANEFAEEWANGEIDPDDVCPICEGPRSRQPRGAIVIRVCRTCGFES